MYGLGTAARWGIAVAILALLAVATLWRSLEPQVPTDYEACVAEAQSNASTGVEDSKPITRCAERFAGRRKPGGGYTYFDFMQNRTFDIAGPNPTEDERRQIDQAYTEFLGVQRRDKLSSVLAKALADQEGANVPPPNVGSPLTLTPKIPLPAKRPPIEHSKLCEDGSLSCSWAKLSATIRNAFASSASANR
jgi:hypothetical protein